MINRNTPVASRFPAADSLLSQMRSNLRSRGYSVNTTDACLYWAGAFLELFHGQIPQDLCPDHLDRFLSHCAQRSTTKNQTPVGALKAVEFLLIEIGDRHLPWLPEYMNSRLSGYRRDYLDRVAMKKLLARLSGWEWLAASLACGAGLTVTECLGLRVRDLHLDSRQADIRASDEIRIHRTADIPVTLIRPLAEHLDSLRNRHIRNLGNQTSGGVQLPVETRRAQPDAGRSWGWQFLFPADSTDHLRMATDAPPNGPAPAKALLRSLDRGALEAGIDFYFTRNSLRNSFAVHRVQEGHSPDHVRQMLGLQSRNHSGTPHVTETQQGEAA